jgi:DNA mismatch repair protein MutL
MNAEAGHIIILSPDVACQIAAGEVVERPASVVKELMENAIDAGADTIVVRVVGGGQRLVEVADNGSGMVAADVDLALQRHATSKIHTVEDLMSANTLGFRGEALPSIASVSRLEILTKPRENAAGTYVRVEAGEVVERGERARDQGTTVTVRDLFYNTPARRKFLRSTSTELRRIVQEVTVQSCARPSLRVTLIHGREPLLDLPPAEGLAERLAALFGRNFVESMIPVHVDGPIGSVTGFVARPDAASASRRQQYLFVNGRAIVSRLISHAIYTAYSESLRDRHPAYVLNLELPLDRIDVNVHPAKREVRFSDDSSVHNLVARAVRNAVRSVYAVPTGLEGRARERPMPPHEYRPRSQAPPERQAIQDLFQEAPPSHMPPEPATTEPDRSAFWQLHNSYIFAQTKTGVLIVDQHAAHERIIYEQILHSRLPAVSQQLLFPLTVDLSESQRQLFLEVRDELKELGFVVKEFGGRTVVIEAVPTVAESFTQSSFLDLLDELGEIGGKPEERREAVAKAFACKAAVKANASLTPEEMNALVDRLFASENPYFCPHGRPTMIRITHGELERRFGRS